MGAEGGLVSNLDDLLEGGGMLARLLREGEISDALEKLIQKSGREILDPRPDGCSLLHRFTILGSYDAVKILREKGARPSVLKSDDSTLLHSALRTTLDGDTTQDAQRANILELFLTDKRHPMSIDQRNTKGWTALKLASRKGLERCVETLLKHGADPNITDNENYLPLHNAIGNHPIVKLLVSYPQHNINAQTQNGQSPLHIGVESGNVQCVLTLLEHEADPNINNKEGITPLFLAARGGNIELVRVLLRHNACVNVTGGAQQIAPLHWAAHKEFTDIALHLIENGADIQLRDKEGRTPLGLASPELASKMIEVAKRRNPNFAPNSISKEATISAEEKAVRACCEGNVQALQAILQAGMNINLTNNGTSLLHMGAYCGQLNVTALLMRSGADWQSCDKDGDTVLHFACMKETPQGNHEPTLKFLLSTPAGSLINSQNQKGDTPLLVAVRCGFFNRTQILLQHNADSTIRNAKNELSLHRSCCGDTNIGLVFQLAEMLPDMDVQDKDGWTPLMYAARSHSPVITHYLLQRGADPNLQQVSGFTALHLAAQENQYDICQLLLKYKANPNLTGGPQSLTPLHIASHKSFMEICCLLTEKGADVTIQDKDGDTPLSLTHDDAIKQAIQSAHDIYNAQRRERSNSHPTTPPPLDGFKCFFRKDSKKEFDEKSTLQDIITEKEDLLQTLVSNFKTLTVENEYLHSKLKSYEEDLHCKGLPANIELSYEEGEGGESGKPWWLISRQELKLSDKQLNTTGIEFFRFFDIFKGTYRMTNIVARKVNRNENWEPSTKKTFLKEVEGLSRLCSPNIVQFMGACVDEESSLYCVIMEYMPYGDLQSLLHVQKKQMTILQRVKLARDIATGMAYLHSFPILHRNLVPTNILIGENLNAKISDFGLYETKVQTNYYINAKKHCCTKGGSLRPYYRAPEVIEKYAFSTASDVYSFSMILLELVTMKKPFADLDDCSSAMAWVMRLMMGTRPPIPSDLDPQCQKMIAQCWHQDPAMRPSFKEFLVSCHRKIEHEIQNELEANKTTQESSTIID